MKQKLYTFSATILGSRTIQVPTTNVRKHSNNFSGRWTLAGNCQSSELIVLRRSVATNEFDCYFMLPFLRPFNSSDKKGCNERQAANDLINFFRYAHETVQFRYSFQFFTSLSYVSQIPDTNVIRTRFKAAKFIAKSSGISRKYGEDIKRIGFPCKHELMFAMIRNEPLNCVSFFRCLRRPLAESHFFLSVRLRQTMVVLMQWNAPRLCLEEGSCRLQLFHCKFAVYYLPVKKSRVHLLCRCVFAGRTRLR